MDHGRVVDMAMGNLVPDEAERTFRSRGAVFVYMVSAWHWYVMSLSSQCVYEVRTYWRALSILLKVEISE